MIWLQDMRRKKKKCRLKSIDGRINQLAKTASAVQACSDMCHECPEVGRATLSSSGAAAAAATLHSCSRRAWCTTRSPRRPRHGCHGSRPACPAAAAAAGLASTGTGWAIHGQGRRFGHSCREAVRSIINAAASCSCWHAECEADARRAVEQMSGAAIACQQHAKPHSDADCCLKDAGMWRDEGFEMQCQPGGNSYLASGRKLHLKCLLGHADRLAYTSWAVNACSMP